MPPEQSHAALQAAFHSALWRSNPPPGLTAPSPDEIAQRFAVYRNNVRHSLIKALAARFPVVEALVGSTFFAAMAQIFIAHAPPRSPVLAEWGGDFPGFLDGFAPVAHLPWLSDVARLELARGRARDAADVRPVAHETLAARTDLAQLRLVLHPSAQVFASDHPAVGIWRAHQRTADRASVGHGPQWALIGRRPDFEVVIAAVDADTHAVLRKLADGEPLGKAAHGKDPITALSLLLRHGLIVDSQTGDIE